MRILVLCTDSYGGHGGIALYNRDLIEALAIHPSVDEIVVVPRLIRGQIQAPPENVRFLWRAAHGMGAYLAQLALLGMRRDQFDLVICSHINLLPFARLFSSDIVLMIYGVEAWKKLRVTTLPLIGDVAAVISISEITLSRFKSWSGYEGPSFLLPNAIHLDWFGVQARDQKLESRYGLEGRCVLLTLGRIELAERYKGFDEVLEVLPELASVIPHVSYVIAGGGGDIARLEAKAAALGVRDHVVFTGMVNENEKAALYGLADVYVMPSRGEGFGFVLLEALACGVPVIASRLDGGYEAIRQGLLGRAVDPSSPGEIRAAILDVLAEGKRGIPDGIEYFGFDNFISRVHSVLDNLMWSDE